MCALGVPTAVGIPVASAAPVPVAPERLAVENHVVQKTVFVVEFHNYRERLLAATESGTVFH